MTLSLEIQTALACVQDAANIAMPLFRQSGLLIDYKADSSPVTQADKQAEQAIRARIARAFPDDKIFGEEFGGTLDLAGRQWVIDPIDGTKSFATGNPLFGHLLGLLEDGVPKIGVAMLPALGRVYFGDGQQSFVIDTIAPNNEILQASEATQIKGSAVQDISISKLLTTSADFFTDPQDRDRFYHVAQQAGLYAFGGDCHNYMLVASAYADMVIEDGLSSYDILPLVPILQGAGCVISDWQGNALGATNYQQIVACANAPLHQKILAYLN